ncbi:MAG: thiamine-phosphate kinase [Chloroflexi bacterium]|nr:thiamine-phosphate kinase [Chloroflexota bacterium]
MLISEIGEFGLIGRIKEGTPLPRNGVVVGIGDDVAVLRAAEGRYLLATCDIQVEGVHFLKDKISPYQLGRKAVAINVSDIASMGGQPRYLLVSLNLSADATVEYTDALYQGLWEEAGRFGVDIVGGNVSRSPAGTIIDVFLLGEAEPEGLLLRSGARPGDLILITGELGNSAAGLTLLLNPDISCPEEHAGAVKAAHLTPTPRLKEGQLIARSKSASAMIDLSDGLASDITRICEASRVGATIWAQHIPISLATRAVAQLVGKDPLDLALFGGEDYELLLTAPPEKANELAAAVLPATGTPLTVVGEIAPSQEGKTLVLKTGERVPLEARGWDHFRQKG